MIWIFKDVFGAILIHGKVSVGNTAFVESESAVCYIYSRNTPTMELCFHIILETV
jgi:hypothetical protein